MHPLYRKTRQKTLIIGSFAILIGFFGTFIPVLPGTLFVVLGLSVLSLQSKIALRTLISVRTRYPKLASPVKHAETWLVDFFNLTTHRREYVSVPRDTEGTTLSVLAEPTEFVAGTAILLHSASGTAETDVMNTLAEAFKIRGFCVVRFDAYNSLGDSSGDFSKFTTTSYRKDLECVIEWAGSEPWWQEPLVLVGHSLGGLVAGMYAREHQAEVDELVLLAPTLSGQSYVETYLRNNKEDFDTWKSTSERLIEHPISHAEFSLPFSFVEDMEQYSLLPTDKNLPIPTTVFAGENDITSDYSELKTFCEKVGNHATLKKLKGVGHTPRTRHDIEVLAQALSKLRLKATSSVCNTITS
ncbi:MAG: hypothetical protein UU89_C0009G0013 [Parcubacteria group bacterium GW2011_GWC2_42_11]|nr:MAG: hypothetical protein UU89_C0009G0013 [Parcubacteria group bacterium GW2011_GWC2_42_11]